MSCHDMQINSIRQEIAVLEQKKAAQRSAIERGVYEDLDKQIAQLEGQITQLEKDDEEWHRLMGDLEARSARDDDDDHRHHNHHPHLNQG